MIRYSTFLFRITCDSHEARIRASYRLVYWLQRIRDSSSKSALGLVLAFIAMKHRVYTLRLRQAASIFEVNSSSSSWMSYCELYLSKFREDSARMVLSASTYMQHKIFVRLIRDLCRCTYIFVRRAYLTTPALSGSRTLQTGVLIIWKFSAQISGQYRSSLLLLLYSPHCATNGSTSGQHTQPS